MNETIERDPVCGMTVPIGGGIALRHEGQVFTFCSTFCRSRFLESPRRYASEESGTGESADPGGRRVAYFSMEIAVSPDILTYSGGLGVLAGDLLRSAADLRVPMVGVTLLYRGGYFTQRLGAGGEQWELPGEWRPEDRLEPLDGFADVEIEGRTVALRGWRFEIEGRDGYRVPVIFLDTDLEQNDSRDRAITHELYGRDDAYRLAQEIVLGIGGVRLLRQLGFHGIRKYHLNEGHAALLTLELLRESDEDFEAVRRRCVFTTHTPVPAGHDRFDYGLVERLLGKFVSAEVLRMLGTREVLNLTHLALNLSGFINGVARPHEETSREMFPAHEIGHVTNGVHSETWVCPDFADLFDRRIRGWRDDPGLLRHALSIPSDEIRRARRGAKRALLEVVRERTGIALAPEVFTIGFARRATPYKRADLVFSDPERLVKIAAQVGDFQFVMAGKAHPRDEEGKQIIRRIFRAAEKLRARIPIVYLEDHDLALAKHLISGVDLWLNTPRRPLEASGTSGMKAAHNGIPSLSTHDGWWVEGGINFVTGWTIGAESSRPLDAEAVDRLDAKSLYVCLEDLIVPLFYNDPERWADVMRNAIAVNASHFNTHRVLRQYATHAYLA